MTRQPSNEPSSPINRRIHSSGQTCPGAPVKQKQVDSSKCRFGDDWLMEWFDNSEASSPMTTSNWLHPRRLFPEDDQNYGNYIQQQQQQHQNQQQHSEPPTRRQLFRDGDFEERQNASPTRPVRQQQQHHRGEVIGIITPPAVPIDSRREGN
jgi:hypothetical protein